MSGYIGTQPVPQATQTRDSFTATSGQTSFATSGYTPNYLDVYLNGVKLAAADYTATNGSEVVLASGASTGDILEVVAYTTFTTADIPAGTPSIDDNGNATALTITSDEEVLIGKTTDAQQTAGTTLYQNGQIYSTVNGSQSLVLTRKTNDGALALFYKDTNEVGRIASSGGGVHYNGVGLGLRMSGTAITPTNGSTNVEDATNDFGTSAARFKDLYLSGGVYLGGTGSANKLDDYEEGTWSPTNAGDSTGTISANGKYVKIGRQVTCHATMSITATFTNPTLGGLPFNPDHEETLSSIHSAAVAIGSNVKMVSVNNGSGNITTRDVDGNAVDPSGSQLIRFTIVYQTTA
jgi:hypothetical protein